MKLETGKRTGMSERNFADKTCQRRDCGMFQKEFGEKHATVEIV